MWKIFEVFFERRAEKAEETGSGKKLKCPKAEVTLYESKSKKT